MTNNTGTPIRSDGERSVWLAYDDAGAINHPEEGTYTLTYGEAVDLGYCRPVKLLEAIEGEAPMIVHSQMNNPDARIKAFRNTDKRWIVSVAMISEGVDIKRLRVLVHLPNALTELAFRQAIGRVVRTQGHDDDTRAYVVMPCTETFEAYRTDGASD